MFYVNVENEQEFNEFAEIFKENGIEVGGISDGFHADNAGAFKIFKARGVNALRVDWLSRRGGSATEYNILKKDILNAIKNPRLSISRSVSSILESFIYDLELEIPSGVTSKISYLKIEDGGMISFLDQNKIERIRNEGGSFWSSVARRKYQTVQRAGRVFRKFFTYLNDAELSNVVSAYNAKFVETEFKFKEVEGEDIRKYYNQDKYASDSGTLGGSCMRYDDCSNYMDIYVDNCVKLIIYVNSCDEITGRALLWEVEYKGNKRMFMDRIYTNDYKDEERFKMYAESKGYLYKLEQSYGTEGVCDNGDIDHKGEMIVEASFSVSGQDFPFMDTMCYGNVDGTKLSTHEQSDSMMLLRSTDGGFETINGFVWSEYDGLYHRYEDCVESGYDGWILKEDAITDIHDRYIHKDSAVELEGKIYHTKYVSENFVKYNGKMVDKATLKKSDLTNNYYPASELVSAELGYYILYFHISEKDKFDEMVKKHNAFEYTPEVELAQQYNNFTKWVKDNG